MSQQVKVRAFEYSRAAQTIEVPTSMGVTTDEPAAGLGVFRILTPEHGDLRLTWEADAPQAVKDAELTFNRLRDTGLTPYRMGGGKKPSNRLDQFDRTERDVVFLPTQLAAGG